MPTWPNCRRAKTSSPTENDLPPPAENEFYYRDVIGCEVFLTDGVRIGVVEEIIATGANDVFVVRGDGKEVLVPVIEDVVKAIDSRASASSSRRFPGYWIDRPLSRPRGTRHRTSGSIGNLKRIAIRVFSLA